MLRIMAPKYGRSLDERQPLAFPPEPIAELLALRHGAQQATTPSAPRREGALAQKEPCGLRSKGYELVYQCS